VGGETTFASADELAAALRLAETAHGKHERCLGRRDEAWLEWHAECRLREQAGVELPT
jgi:hypothetical protein